MKLSPDRTHQRRCNILGAWRRMLQEKLRVTPLLNDRDREYAEQKRRYVVYCEVSMGYWSIEYNRELVEPLHAA